MTSALITFSGYTVVDVVCTAGFVMEKPEGNAVNRWNRHKISVISFLVLLHEDLNFTVITSAGWLMNRGHLLLIISVYTRCLTSAPKYNWVLLSFLIPRNHWLCTLFRAMKIVIKRYLYQVMFFILSWRKWYCISFLISLFWTYCLMH